MPINAIPPLKPVTVVPEETLPPKTSPIQKNNTDKIMISWVPRSEGEHNITVTFDCFNEVNESNESDNKLSFLIYVNEAPIKNRAYQKYLVIDACRILNRPPKELGGDILKIVPQEI